MQEAVAFLDSYMYLYFPTVFLDYLFLLNFSHCSFNFTMSGGGGASMADKDFAAADEDFDMMAFLALAT